MHVHFLTDEPNKIAKMRALLEPAHHVDPTILGKEDIRVVPEAVLMSMQTCGGRIASSRSGQTC